MGGALEYRQLRAPAGHGAVLINPPLSAAGALVEANEAQRLAREYDCQGRLLSDLSDAARSDLVRQALQYTGEYRNVDPSVGSSGRILLAGHQPELFHSGVWFKNFALGMLAVQLDAAAVNLLVDNDPVRRVALRVPGGSLTEPHWVDVPWDTGDAEIPYEERAVADMGLFESFGKRVADVIQPLVPDPLVRRLWPDIVEAVGDTGYVGQSIARARHRLEGKHGLATLELPLSLVCQTDPFYWFVVHLLAQLPRLWELYNGSLSEYRLVHHIRSRAHPVPDLAADQQWLEAPFWIWNTDEPRRRRLFVRQRDDTLELTDRGNFRCVLPVSDDQEGPDAVAKLAQITATGYKLRPRALITTMYARLFLGDLFLHGIGGAKYDQLTDMLIERFWGFQPPAFLTVTATVQLPLGGTPVSIVELQNVTQQLRQLRYQPERHMDMARMGASDRTHEARRLIGSKRKWINTDLPRGRRRQRHEEICRANESLQPFVSEKRRDLENQQRNLESKLRTQAVLSSREYSFCLFPEEFLPAYLLDRLAT